MRATNLDASMMKIKSPAMATNSHSQGSLSSDTKFFKNSIALFSIWVGISVIDVMNRTRCISLKMSLCDFVKSECKIRQVKGQTNFHY